MFSTRSARKIATLAPSTPVIHDSRDLTMQQARSLVAAASALSAGVPFSSLANRYTYNAEALAELVEMSQPVLTMNWTAEQEQDYRELVLRH